MVVCFPVVSIPKRCPLYTSLTLPNEIISRVTGDVAPRNVRPSAVKLDFFDGPWKQVLTHLGCPALYGGAIKSITLKCDDDKVIFLNLFLSMLSFGGLLRKLLRLVSLAAILQTMHSQHQMKDNRIEVHTLTFLKIGFATNVFPRLHH